MAYLDWPQNLNTGVEVIDQQHKRIVQYINELHAAYQKGDQQLTGEVLSALVDYTISHFAFEENLMEKAEYTFIEPHKRVHFLFIERVEHFKTRFNNGEDITKELLYMLENWLFNHIRHEDGDYAPTVSANMPAIRRETGWMKKTLARFFPS